VKYFAIAILCLVVSGCASSSKRVARTQAFSQGTGLMYDVNDPRNF
jgi:uncharacterized protein YceK